MTALSVPQKATLQEQLVANLSPRLKTEHAWFLSSMAKEAKATVLVWYERGVHAQGLANLKESDGRLSLEVLADALQVTRGYLHNLAHLAGRYTLAEVKAKIELRMKNGQPLEKGHFVQLARIENKDKRAKMEKKVLVECLAVSSLESEVNAAAAPRPQTGGKRGRKSIGPRSPGAAVISLRKKCEQLSRDASKYLDQLEKLEASPDEYRELPFFQDLDTTVEALQEAQEFINVCRTRIITLKSGKSESKASSNGAPRTAVKKKKKKAAAAK